MSLESNRSPQSMHLITEKLHRMVDRDARRDVKAKFCSVENGHLSCQGKWTDAEEVKFLEALELHGRDWDKVSSSRFCRESFLGSRTDVCAKGGDVHGNERQDLHSKSCSEALHQALQGWQRPPCQGHFSPCLIRY